MATRYLAIPMMMWHPEAYEAWYYSPRGQWIASVEYDLMMRLLGAEAGTSLLDVGCGTGYFSRRFKNAGLSVTGVDANEGMVRFASQHSDGIVFQVADALKLPYQDQSFDYCAAVTSLCFISEPVRALAEMMRVVRRSIVLGLLNRNSLLYLQKHGQGSYENARWDQKHDVDLWARYLGLRAEICYAVFLPSGTMIARIAEGVLPHMLPFGAFLAAKISR